MDKQTLRYTFLLYFAGQYAKKEDMEYDTLLEMSDNNYDLCSEVVCDMVKEGLVSGIELIETKAGYAIGQYQGKLKLTSKGLKEIMGLFPEEKKEIIDEIQKGNNFIDNKEDLLENFLKKEKNRISQLSNENKNKEIIEKILSYFKFLNANIHNYPDGKIKSSEIKEKVKNILSIYYEKAPQIFAQKVTKEMLEDYGYITFLYKKISPDEYDIDKLLTSKGASYLEQLEKDYKEKFENYCKENNIKFPDPIGSNAKILKTIKNSPTQKAIESVQNFHKIFSNEQLTELIKKANIADRAAQSITNINPITLSPNVIDEVKKDKEGNETKDNKEKTYTFEGILGQNCGDYITVNESNKDDRLPDRIIHDKTGQHFIVKNGIKVLRGFAKASDLYFASEPDKKNYQREENDIHLEELSEFISEMNPSGKYLPELTFIARGGYELCRPDWGKKLTATQLGFFKNSNYYQLHLNGTKLYRIDGNHRLEALHKLSTEQKEYYIPFAIILMGKQVLFDDTDQVESSLGLEFSGNYGLVDDQDEKKIIDMEAFLFYFLNAKAKKLTTEENYRGLISSDWQKHEIEIANKNIILLQRLNKLLEDNILHNDFCNNEPLKQISEILEKINEDIELNKFVKIVKIMNNLLAADCWQNLKKFEFYCQLIFYVAYKHEDETECRQILNNLEYWVEKYNFDNTTFDNPILLYNNAQKTNNVDPINIFVAMPFDDIHINNFTEWIETAIKNIEENKPQYKGRIHLYEIMRHRGYNIDLMDDIMEKINNCSIFIAEISPCKYTFEDKQILCDANPNVMYELGIAYNLKKPIILMRESSDFPKVPSDIQEKYRNTYNRSNTKTTREIIENTISAILEDYYD